MIESCGYRKYWSKLDQPARSVCEWIIVHMMEATNRMVAQSSTQLFVIHGALSSRLLPLHTSVNAAIEELINGE